MAANIRSLVNAATPIIGASRDDLTVGDIVTLNSVDVATTYGWTMAYQPEGSTATFSGSVLAQSPGSFTVDKEGPYLVRLTVDFGLPTASTQYVRLRYLTLLGSLKLVAAGENNDGSTPWPIPVDNTPAGWADSQNFNLLTLLGLIQESITSGRITYVDPDSSAGDWNTVQEGIDYAIAQGAASGTPWVVAVRPSTYNEDVIFKPFAHVIAWPGVIPDQSVVRITGTTGHTTSLTGAGETVILRGLSLTSSDALGTVLTKSGAGVLWIDKCYLQQLSATGTEGPALDHQAGTVTVLDSYLYGAQGGALTDRFAFTQTAGTASFYRTQFFGASGCDVGGGASASFHDCAVVASGPAGALGISSLALSLTLDYCHITAPTSGDALQVNPTGAGTAGAVSAILRWTYIGGDVYFDTNAVVGATSLYVGSCEYTAITLPSGNPGTLEATTKSTSLFYDNTTTGITAENVQDAIDEVHALAVAVTTLDEAYDGGVGGGVGRTIIADAGAVQIVDAAVPSDPPDVNNPDGRLQAVGGIEVGSISKPEILIDPNPYGDGPLIEMGQAVWPGNAPFGGTGFVQGSSTGNPLYRNYNLRVGTESTDGGGSVGRVTIRGGDAIQSGTTPDAAPVIVQAGSSADGAVTPGDVILLPGSVPGTDGSVYIGSLNGATGAIVTASGVFVGGVAGTIRFGTEMGAIEVTIGAADNLAAVIVLFNATGQVIGTDAGGGVLRLTTVTTGPGSEIYFLNDDQGGALDNALGQFDGQPMTLGTYGSTVGMYSSAANELTVGADGATGPMIYNGATGKLTVPGIIDPLGLLFDEGPAVVVPAAEGFTWVSDGSGALIQNDLYYLSLAGTSAGVPINLSMAGATTLYLLGNFASNKDALAFLRAAHLDTNGDGTGNPQNGHWYLNTTRDCIRAFDGAVWQGTSVSMTHQTGVVDVWVDSVGGSDAGGDGLTLATAYATPEAGMQDIPLQIDTGCNFNLQLAGAGPYDVHAGYMQRFGTYPYAQTLAYAGDWMGFSITGDDLIPHTGLPGGVVNGTLTIGGAGVLVDTRTGGRYIPVTDALTAHALKQGKVEIITCAGDGTQVGVQGIVQDNDTTGIYLDIESDVYGALANGDTIRITEVQTEIRGISNAWENLEFDGDTIWNRVKITAGNFGFRSSQTVFLDCTFVGGYPIARSGRVALKRCHYCNTPGAGDFKASFGLEGGAAFLEQCNVIDCWDGARQVLKTEDYDNLVLFGQWNSIVHCAGWVVGGGTILDTVPAAGDGVYLRYVDCTGDAFTWGTATDSGYRKWWLPYIVGSVTGYLIDYGGLASLLYPLEVRFTEQPNLTTAGATTNVCRLNSVVDTYSYTDMVKIIGTGNARVQLCDLKDWMPDQTAPYLVVKVGRNEAMEFATAAIASGDTGFLVPGNYIPGTQLQVVFDYVSEDPASGHFAVVDVDAGLFREGIDDASAEPPANLNQDLTNLVPVSSGAGILERSQNFDLTDAAGAINGIALEEGQYVTVRVRRDGTHMSDDCTGALYILRVGRIWNVGL